MDGEADRRPPLNVQDRIIRPAVNTPCEVPSTVRISDIVVSGCGRVYAFPPDLPQAARVAGLGHPRYRVGYVDRVGAGWLPRDLGNRIAGHRTRSRLHAVCSVVAKAGVSISTRSDLRKAAVFRVGVADANESSFVIHLDPLGTVKLGHRTPDDRIRFDRELGAVWATGTQYAALGLGQYSDTRTLHRTIGAAVHALRRLDTATGALTHAEP